MSVQIRNLVVLMQIKSYISLPVWNTVNSFYRNIFLKLLRLGEICNLKHKQTKYDCTQNKSVFTYSTHTHTHTHMCVYIYIYRVEQEECARLREGVPYVRVYRYNPKHLYPKLNGLGDNGQ